MCDRFVALHDAGDPVEAARHLSSCAECRGDQQPSASLPRIVQAPGTAVERTIPIDGRLVVGRECAGIEDGHRLLLEDPQISRVHVEIRVDPELSHAWVTDTSTNGTLLDGETIEHGVREELHPGASLRLGAIELRFEDGGVPAVDARTEDLDRTVELAGVVGLVGAARRIGDGTDDGLADLTEREREVLVMMARGDSDDAIADAVGLSPRRVESHARSVFGKLRIPGTVEDNRRVRQVLAYLSGARREHPQADPTVA